MINESMKPGWLEFSKGLVFSSELELQSQEATNEVRAFHDQEGMGFVLKGYRSHRAHSREKYALQAWAPQLDCACPQVVGDFPLDGPALLLTRLSGRQASQGVSHPWLLAREAGRALRQLHDLKVEDVDRLDPRDAVSQRFHDAIRRAANWLSSGERRFVHKIEKGLSQLPLRQRVVCHGDYVHRNWLWCDDRDELGILDFENSRLDLAEFDFLKLHMESWGHEADSKAAFLNGYGVQWTTDNQVWVETLEVLYRLGTANWMRQAGSASEEKKARAAFAALARGR